MNELTSRGDFSPDHLEAARQITEMWRAFSRFLSIAARNYNGGTSNRSRVLEPLDLMSDEQVLSWKSAFQPWHVKASRRRAPSSRPVFISGAFVVIHALTMQEPTSDLDQQFGFARGDAVRVLRDEFSSYLDPKFEVTYTGVTRERNDRVFANAARSEDTASSVT